MVRIVRYIKIIVFSTVLINTFVVAGSKVKIVLRSDTTSSGELLAVCESVIVIAKDFGATADYLRTHLDKLETFQIKEIKSVVILRSNYLVDGITLGLIGGIGIGALMHGGLSGETKDHELGPNAPGSNVILYFAAVGVAFGALAGATVKTEDVEVSLGKNKNIEFLKLHARFREVEPEFIKRLYTVAKFN